MPRAIHSGRPAPAPFADAAVTAAQTATAHALPEQCKYGTVTTTQDPTPPYGTTETFVPVATAVPCIVEPGDDRPVDVAGDPSTLALFDIRIPHGNAITVDHIIELTAGRNLGMRAQVIEVHDSTTEALLRVTAERITGGTA